MKYAVAAVSALGLFVSGGLAIAQQPPVARPTAIVSAMPAAQILSTVPMGSVTVTDWYKQNVYDSANVKIGDISDVLVSPMDGKITALIIGVGGFLGMGEKEVAVPFDVVQHVKGEGKAHLTLNTTKEALKLAPGFKYDRKTSTWIVASVEAK